MWWAKVETVNLREELVLDVIRSTPSVQLGQTPTKDVALIISRGVGLSF